jgi:hypothetical protein
VTLEDLETELAGMFDPLDVPGDWPLRQRNDYELRRHVLTTTIRGAKNAHEVVAAVEPQLARAEQQLADMLAAREELVKELLVYPPPARTRAYVDKQRELQTSIKILDGRFDVQNEAYPTALSLPGKLQARGYPASLAVPLGGLPSLPTLEAQLKDLQRRRDAARADLAALLADNAFV